MIIPLTECAFSSSHAYLLGELKKGIIALSSEVVTAAIRRCNMGHATLLVELSHPGVDQPAGEPARGEWPGRQEHELELLRVRYDPPACFCALTRCLHL